MRNLGIRKKFMLVFLLSTILPLTAAMLVSYTYAYSHFDSEILSYNENLMYQFSTNIDNYLHHISGCVYYPYSNDAANSLLSTTAPSYTDYATMLNFMKTVDSLSPDITEIYLQSFFRNTEYFYKNQSLSSRKLDDAEIQEMIRASSDIRARPQLLPSSEGAGLRTITFSYLMENIPQRDLMGRLSIELSLHTIDGLSMQMLSSEQEILTIVDRARNAVVYSTDASRMEEPLDRCETLYSIVSSAGQPIGHIIYGPRLNTSVAFFDTVSIFDTDWLIIKEVPSRAVYKSMYAFTRLYLPIYLLFLCAAVALTMQISKRFTDPIIRLTRQMTEIRYGEPLEPMILNQHDEIGTLTDTFYEMVKKINDMILNEYELQLSKKNAQLHMLQAQLNPHFLNNALQSMGTLALQKQAPEVYSLITSLSCMMNYAMDIKQPLVSLDKEFEYTEHYLIFQKQRFGDAVHYSLRPNPDTLELIVPKMLLQPIVENYFKHGFLKRPEGYQIAAETHIEGDTLVIVVENNGACIEEADLEQLREGLLHTTEIMDNDEYAFGIGLYNIQTRLNLYYNHHGHILLENRTPYGVRIELRLDMREYPNENTDCG